MHAGKQGFHLQRGGTSKADGAVMSPESLMPEVRRLRDLHANDAKPWGNRRIGTELGIGKDAALRLLNKIKLQDAAQNKPAAIVEIEPRTASEYAERISSCLRKTVESMIEVGRLLIRAKESLPHGEFLGMIESGLPFGPSTAARFMKIASDNRIVAHVQHLPAAWGTLYELTKLNDEAFQSRIDDGTIRPDMERRDVAAEIKRETRGRQEADIAKRIAKGDLYLPNKRYGVILADPAWKFETWSEKGRDRAAGNHYAETETGKIAALPVQDIAAPDCVLFLWATAPMLPAALYVMEKWGFAYKTHCIWDKNIAGTGYWFRNRHELLLVGTRGKIPAPAPGDQHPSVCEFDRKEHSAKPEFYHRMIESYFPTLPKIELNARGHARPGWDSWGAEASDQSEAAE